MVFGIRGPPLSRAEREAVARFRERRANGGAPRTPPYAPPSPPPASRRGGGAKTKAKAEKTRAKARADVARDRDHNQSFDMPPPPDAGQPACAPGLGALLGRVRENPVVDAMFPRDGMSSPRTSQERRPRPSRAGRGRRDTEDARPDADGGTHTGVFMRARIAGIGSRLKQFTEAGPDGKAGAAGDGRRAAPMNTSRGLGRKGSFFKGRRKAGDPEQAGADFSDDDEERREDDAYFHDLMHDGDDR